MTKAKTVYDVSLIKIEHLQVHCDETVCISLCVCFFDAVEHASPTSIMTSSYFNIFKLYRYIILRC